MDMLVHRHRNETSAQKLDDVCILKSRRTVGDAVVSDATQRMAAAAQHVDRLVLLGRKSTCLHERELPGQGLPRFLDGGQLLVQSVELRWREVPGLERP